MLGRIEISLDTIRTNARRLRDFVAPARIGFAVKSNAYGHGIGQVGLAAEPIASYLCVYGADEAVVLRNEGVTKPILIMGPVEPSALDAVLKAKAAVALWNTGSYVHRVSSVARAHNAVFPVHVKVNTGLNRLGLSPHDAADAIEDFLRIPGIRVDGVFSHLAAAEELDSPYTLSQLEVFQSALAPVQPQLNERSPRALLHIAASAAAMLWPQTRLDMVRVGIALYGLWPSLATRQSMNDSGLHLEPALRYSAPLVAVRDVEEGAAIGYGTTFHAPQAMRIGVVPVGYAEGIPRALSNTGAFAVHGARCPIVGRICMNMCMIDVTKVPQAHAGDTVTLIGKDGETEISADDWANWANTINYEIVTRLPETVPRMLRQAQHDTLI
ncbi:MAG: alanine racemase [Candidatus Meridianibacter frigidus]|nr:MAG: alanine racemase [Candidatus Eremiobacteraeota bacterium]